MTLASMHVGYGRIADLSSAMTPAAIWEAIGFQVEALL